MNPNAPRSFSSPQFLLALLLTTATHTLAVTGQAPSLTGEQAVSVLQQHGLYDTVMRTLNEARYEIAADPQGDTASYHAANPAQGLRAAFSPGGTSLRPASAESAPWETRWHLCAWGYDEALEPVADAELAANTNRVEYLRILSEARSRHKQAPPATKAETHTSTNRPRFTVSKPQQRRIVGYLAGLAGPVVALARLQSETAAALAALLPSILDKAFKGQF